MCSHSLNDYFSCLKLRSHQDSQYIYYEDLLSIILALYHHQLRKSFLPIPRNKQLHFIALMKTPCLCSASRASASAFSRGLGVQRCGWAKFGTFPDDAGGTRLRWRAIFIRCPLLCFLVYTKGSYPHAFTVCCGNMPFFLSWALTCLFLLHSISVKMDVWTIFFLILITHVFVSLYTKSWMVGNLVSIRWVRVKSTLKVLYSSSIWDEWTRHAFSF